MSDEILGVLTAIHRDVGELKGKTDLLLGWAQSHTAEDKAAHARITSLENLNEQAKGRSKLLHALSAGAGAVIGATAPLLSAWFKSRHP